MKDIVYYACIETIKGKDEFGEDEEVGLFLFLTKETNGYCVFVERENGDLDMVHFFRKGATNEAIEYAVKQVEVERQRVGYKHHCPQ